MNIILDIDGTLISEFGDDCKIIKPRPHLDTFLKTCFDLCVNVSIWTAADKEWFDRINRKYLDPILTDLGEDFAFVFCGRVTRVVDPDFDSLHPMPIQIKPLKKVWKKKGFGIASGYRPTAPHTRHNTLIVDDTPHTYMRNYGNAIPVITYNGGDSDDQLLRMCDLLKKLKDDFNKYGTIRHTDKRSY